MWGMYSVCPVLVVSLVSYKGWGCKCILGDINQARSLGHERLAICTVMFWRSPTVHPLVLTLFASRSSGVGVKPTRPPSSPGVTLTENSCATDDDLLLLPAREFFRFEF